MCESCDVGMHSFVPTVHAILLCTVCVSFLHCKSVGSLHLVIAFLYMSHNTVKLSILSQYMQHVRTYFCICVHKNDVRCDAE